MHTVTMVVPGRPITMNAEARVHRQVAARNTRALRSQAKLLTADWSPLRWEHCTMDVRQLSKDRRWLQDLMAQAPAVKACVDGVVDAGYLPDDTAEYVRSITFHPPKIVGFDALQIDFRYVLKSDEVVADE